MALRAARSPGLLAAALAGAAVVALCGPVGAQPAKERGGASGAHPGEDRSSVAGMPRLDRPGGHLLKLGYQVYLGGLNAFAFTVDVALDRDGYRLSGVGESRGLTRLMWKWAAALKSGGALGPEDMQPLSYDVTTWSRRGEKSMHLSFEADGKYAIRREPPDDEYRKSKRVLPDSLPANALDPLSVSLRIARAVADGKGCGGTHHIFDGDRRYDLIFTDLGTERLAPTPYSAFSGAATHCRFDIKRILGFKEKRENLRYWDEDGLDPPEVWLGRVVPQMPPVPVLLHGDLSMGGLRIYLVWAEFAGRPVYPNAERPVLEHAGGQSGSQ